LFWDLDGSNLNLDEFWIIDDKRNAKVATEITDKGYCSTKSMYYYGLKLHALAFHGKKRLPFPEQVVITPASENDLNVFKQDWGNSPFKRLRLNAKDCKRPRLRHNPQRTLGVSAAIPKLIRRKFIR
jgi:hypothetical protein